MALSYTVRSAPAGVIDVATQWDGNRPLGSLVLSGSRDAVIVHRAVLRTDRDRDRLTTALSVLDWARMHLVTGWVPEQRAGSLDDLRGELGRVAAGVRGVASA